MDCEHLESELWAWQDNPPAHPSHEAMQAHLAQCAPCRASLERLRELKSALRGLHDTPDAGFEARLAQAIQQSEPSAYPADPFLEEDASATPEAVVVDRRARHFWMRPVALVAAGAVAAVLIGLVGRWTAPGTLPVAQRSAPALEAEASLSPPSPAGQAAEDQREGILAERKWEEDSTRAQATRPDAPERLTPVTTTP